MFCRECGESNEPNASACKKCGAAIQSFAANPYTPGQAVAPAGIVGMSVPNYLVQAILVTFCCCLRFGIPAIIYASQVDPKLRSGDIQGARVASKNAKLWSWIAFGLGFTGVAIYLAAVIAFGVLGAAN